MISPRIRKHLVLILPFLGLVFLLFISKPVKPTTIPPENTQATLGWKHYKNSEFGFSFKYPEGQLSNFTVTTSDLGSATFNKLARADKKKPDPNSYNVIFEAGAVKSGKTLEEFIDKNLIETKRIKKQNIVLNSTNGFRLTNVDEKANAYFLYNIFQKNDKIYNFALISDDPVLINANKKLPEEILTTANFE